MTRRQSLLAGGLHSPVFAWGPLAVAHGNVSRNGGKRAASQRAALSIVLPAVKTNQLDECDRVRRRQTLISTRKPAGGCSLAGPSLC